MTKPADMLGRLIRVAIWLALRFPMLCPCRRVVLVRLARLFGFMVLVGHVISPGPMKPSRSPTNLARWRGAYLSFTRTKYADNYDKIKPGTCGVPHRTEVLMNCTSWARSRKGGPPRFCDFSGSSDK